MFPGISNSEKFSFMESNISCRMAYVPFYYSFTLTFIFKVKLCILLVLRLSHKLWEIEQTFLLPRDMKSYICHRMAPLRMLYIMTLTCSFKVTKFEIWISSKKFSSMTFLELVLCDFDPNFQGQTFQLAILPRKRLKMQILLLSSDRT